MSYDKNVKGALTAAGFLQSAGAYFLVDGQYGSTGKGLAAGLLAEIYPFNVDVVISNAGPNSGHTSYFGEHKFVLRQLPTFTVVASQLGATPITYLNGGAVIDPKVLNEEIYSYTFHRNMRVVVHPSAACVTDEALEMDVSNVARIGSTGKGTGPALMLKMMRQGLGSVVGGNMDKIAADVGFFLPKRDHVSLVEVSQGFSLGINSGFYPHTTSRECTVSQALADAQLHPSFCRDTMMVVRAYPIRVAGNSGPCYPDQKEITWDELGVPPEITTVTKKVRRVFTWSDDQFLTACYHNRPGVIMLNFVNYLVQNGHCVDTFVRERVLKNYIRVLGSYPKAILLGYGPCAADVKLWVPQ